MRLRDRTGDVIGRLFVLKRGPDIVQANGRRRVQWECVCECGNYTLVEAGNLNSGHTESCGCLTQDFCSIVGSMIEHGMSGSREWHAWNSARGRVTNPNSGNWRRYGGRGIKMFEGWLNDFQAFYDHIGPCPGGMTLDRINNEGNYEPNNVRWATPVTQIRNRSTSIIVEFGGTHVHLADLAEQFSIKYITVYERVKRQGWDVLRALITPIRERRK